MTANGLNVVVQRLLDTGKTQKLTPEQLRTFYADFRQKVEPLINEHRKRRCSAVRM